MSYKLHVWYQLLHRISEIWRAYVPFHVWYQLFYGSPIMGPKYDTDKYAKKKLFSRRFFILIITVLHFPMVSCYASLMKTTHISSLPYFIKYVILEVYLWLPNIICVVLSPQFCSFASWKWKIPSFCKEDSTNYLYRICYLYGCWQHFKI